MSTASEYVPGTCNIGPPEIKGRRNAAIIAAVLAVLFAATFLTSHADKLWRLFLFIPATSFAIGFQQWYNKFCVGFGLKGVFNFGEMGKTYSVEQQEYFKKDRAKAWKMIIIGLVFGLILAITFYFLPI
ncbi:MAG TPA: hypothetical protein VK806_01480 [Bacteroidia bacterium]|jgi:hypothetical protein|nr:hypothetical protein [Bacteroidia bacterium]